jgi:heterotetrameric sarcosine oxidase delta subunit
MRINCPHCGERSVEEFIAHGPAGLVRPEHSDKAEDWFAYVYIRDNPMGEHDELFQHVTGCRQWLRVRRSTLSHQVLEARPVHPIGRGA